MSEPMFDEEWKDESLILSFHSDASGYQGTELLGQMETIAIKVEELTCKLVEVDFSQLPVFGTTVLEGLFILWRKLAPVEGKLRLFGLSEAGEEVLKITRFDTVWDVDASC